MLYRPEIDGLRSVAVVPVILFHAGFELFAGGFVGVDVFFVISGYLITSIILTEKEAGTFTVVNFYERRARRILPALFLVMAATIPFAWMWMFPLDIRNYSQSLIAVSTFSSNILFWQRAGYFDGAAELNPLLHTWSLAVEEQYYMLFPLFMILAWKLGKRRILAILICLTILSLLIAQWGVLNKPSAAFHLLPTRGWEILVGALAAYHLFGKRNIKGNQLLSLFGLLLIAYAVFAFSAQTPFPGVYALIPTTGAVLIILFSSKNTLSYRLLSNKLFVGMGLLSYSTYLWHQPLLAFARHRSINEPDTRLMLALVFASIALAYFSWKFVEKPFRNRQKISSSHILWSSILGSVFFISIGLLGLVADRYEYRNKLGLILNSFEQRKKLEQKDASLDRRKQDTCSFYLKGPFLPEHVCRYGNKGDLVGALIGDSHAASISHILGEAFGSRQLGMVSRIHLGCPSILNVTIFKINVETNCSSLNLITHKYLLSNKEIRFVIIMSRWTDNIERERFDNGEGGSEGGAFIDMRPLVKGAVFYGTKEKRQKLIQERIKNTVNSFLKAGKQVILVYPVPETGWHVPHLMAKRILWGKGDPPVGTSYERMKDRNHRTIKILDNIGSNKNLHRVRPDKLLCNIFVKNRCIIQLGGKPLYYDDDHLSYRGAQMVVEEVMKFVHE